jgi:membrane-associated protein
MGAGYAFGNFPWIKEHFELVILGIIAVSLLPITFSVMSNRLKRAKALPLDEVAR